MAYGGGSPGARVKLPSIPCSVPFTNASDGCEFLLAGFEPMIHLLWRLMNHGNAMNLRMFGAEHWQSSFVV